MANNCLILGTGYVGTYFLEAFPNSFWTSRKPAESRPTQSLTAESQKTLNDPIYFSLNDRESWKNLPDCKNVLWTFAIRDATEEALALELYDSYLAHKNLIVYSSTSAYKIESIIPDVNEDTPILLENVRFRAEEMLRQKGALILHLSGIIGKDRYPKKWYEMNFVKEGKKILNYVHVDDIVKITDLLFKNFKASERFNLTSGDYKTHRQIADLLGLKIAFANEDGIGDSKRILNKKLLNYLSLPDYQFIKYPEDCM